MFEIYDILDPNVRRQTYPQLNVTLLTIADCLERHHFFKDNWAKFVAGAPEFRGHAAELAELTPAAERGDSDMKAAREEARLRAELSIRAATGYMMIRAIEQKNPALLNDTGVPHKVKHPKVGKAVSAASVQIVLTASHLGKEPRVAVIKGTHIRSGGPYLLQFCKGEPVSEQSWNNFDGHYKTCSRIVLRNLESANRYYFRMRTDGPDGPGPWSQVVSLVIL